MTVGPNRRLRTSPPRRLAMLRGEAQLSQEQVGERTGANRHMVRFWEQGRAAPTPDHLDRLASLYGVSVDWIIGKADLRNAVRLDFQADYSDEEFERIREGFDPQDMDDKWAMFLEGNVLHLHRSWTGLCVYQVTFERREGRFVATDTVAEYSEGHHDEELLRQLIDLWLLGDSARLSDRGPGRRGDEGAKDD